MCTDFGTLYSFLEQVLFQQFRFFLNLYFLVIALTQFIPALRIGYLYTYWGPLVSNLPSFYPPLFLSTKHTCRCISLPLLSLTVPPPCLPHCPQGFVLAVTMTRELYDDFKRFLRDKEVNSQKFTKLTTRGVLHLTLTPSFSFIILCIFLLGSVTVKSKDIQVSDIIILEKVHVPGLYQCFLEIWTKSTNQNMRVSNVP